MPDHAGVYERITVREYLEFFADAFRVPSIGVVDAVLELTDLGKLQDRLVATMSKGMKQRLQLARILLHDPKVLILDEPASDLDPRARIEIRDLLLELRGLGKTIFLSSHILTELSDVCTSIGILERGRLVVAGPIRRDRGAPRGDPRRASARLRAARSVRPAAARRTPARRSRSRARNRARNRARSRNRIRAHARARARNRARARSHDAECSSRQAARARQPRARGLPRSRRARHRRRRASSAASCTSATWATT